MSFLDNLKINNQFPIIFIGSGITQRYFKNAPTWDKLLQLLWLEVETSRTYYARYKELHIEFEGDKFKIYTAIADELENLFDIQFFDGKIYLDNLSTSTAHNEGISPFKTRIANIFNNLELKENKNDELKLFKSMLAKSRLIVTTNYDDFIEKQLNNAIKVRVGNKGLFEPAGDLNELYKIHGSVKNANSIMITTNDYKKMKRTSAIVNAKILSQLTESPILFIGYSLTDENIQSLLADLAENMPFSIEEASKRIGVVQYESEKNDITEVMCDTSFGVHYTQLITDNYEEIYSAISNIDQGFSPSEISKYQHAFKKIIDTKGQRGELKQVLTTFVDLENLPHELKNKNLVVALGDSRYLYKFPDYADYVKAYFLDENSMPTEIAIKFMTSLSTMSPLPIVKYILKKGIAINETTKDKINKRLSKFGSLGVIQKTVNVPKGAEDKIRQYLKENKTPIEILNMTDDTKAMVKIAYFVKNIEDIDAKPLIEYILKNEGDGFIKETNTRKLFMVYSLISETPIKNI